MHEFVSLLNRKVKVLSGGLKSFFAVKLEWH